MDIFNKEERLETSKAISWSAINRDIIGIQIQKPSFPKKTGLQEIIHRCKKNYPDYGLFKKMSTLGAHEYIIFNKQKAYNKSYFIPFLHKIQQGALEYNKTLLYKDISRNLQDETGIKQEITREVNEDPYPNCPPGSYISDYYLSYESEGHNIWRVYAWNGKKQLYKDRCKKHNQEEKELENDILFKGTLLHVASTEQALSHENWLEVLGRIVYLENTIPVEFVHSLKWGLSIFPQMSPKVQLYEKNHISHDALYHAERLNKSIQDAKFNDQEVEFIKKGIRNMYTARAERV